MSVNVKQALSLGQLVKSPHARTSPAGSRLIGRAPRGAQARSAMVVLVGALVTIGCTSAATPRDVDTWIRRVHVVDPESGAIRRHHAIAIRRDTIVAVVPDRAVPRTIAPAAVIDGADAFAIPGLWDAHVHLQQGGGDASLRRAARLLGHGITHARDMGASLADRAAVSTRLAADDLPAPQLRAAGPTFWAYSLPYGDERAKVIVADSTTTQAAVDSIAASGVDFIKVYAGFTAERLRLLVESARRRGLTVAGHAQPEVTLEQHARLGVVTIEHLDFSTLAECTSREANYFDRVIAARFRGSGESVPALLTSFADEVDTERCRASLRRAATAGLVFVPTLATTYLSRDIAADVLTRLDGDDRESCALYLRDFDGPGAAARDAVPAAGRRLMRIVRDAGLPVLAGSDSPALCVAAGEGLVLELQLLGESGYTPLEVLRAATLRPSQVLAPKARLGRLADGHEAHVLLLPRDPLGSTNAYADPVGLWTRGRWRDAAALRELRAK